MAVTSDTIELSVSNPPKTREDALKLAEEQFIYCEDIVLQGTETLEALATELLNSKNMVLFGGIRSILKILY